jgi:hypothetical protein
VEPAKVIAPSHMAVANRGALELLPGIAKGDHDLRGDDKANSRARNQCRTDYDVMEVAGAFVRIAPSVQARTIHAVVPTQNRTAPP